MKKIVLFDFDGTITSKDTLLEFIRFYRGGAKFLYGFATRSPWLALMKVNAIPNWRAKEKVLEWFFGGENIDRFNQRCEQFTKEVLPSLIRPQALNEIRKYQNEGATIVVVSASAENWVMPWCKTVGLDCLATQLEIVDGKITGKISGFNCYGQEKERRIKERYTLSDFHDIVAYGDSSGDFEMLALAKHQHYKPFRN